MVLRIGWLKEYQFIYDRCRVALALWRGYQPVFFVSRTFVGMT